MNNNHKHTRARSRTHTCAHANKQTIMSYSSSSDSGLISLSCCFSPHVSSLLEASINFLIEPSDCFYATRCVVLFCFSCSNMDAFLGSSGAHADALVAKGRRLWSSMFASLKQLHVSLLWARRNRPLLHLEPVETLPAALSVSF